jgi:hypothetical protein
MRDSYSIIKNSIITNFEYDDEYDSPNIPTITYDVNMNQKLVTIADGINCYLENDFIFIRPPPSLNEFKKLKVHNFKIIYTIVDYILPPEDVDYRLLHTKTIFRESKSVLFLKHGKDILSITNDYDYKSSTTINLGNNNAPVELYVTNEVNSNKPMTVKEIIDGIIYDFTMRLYDANRRDIIRNWNGGTYNLIINDIVIDGEWRS